MEKSLVFAGIAPHPPLLVPEVGGDRIQAVRRSREGFQEFARRMVATSPESVVLISPHSPSDRQYFLARSEPELHGDFGDFGARAVRLSFNNDLELLAAIRQAASEEKLELRTLHNDVPLDHGALVPLYYLAAEGWRGPVVVLSFTSQSNGQHLAFGRSIRLAAERIGRRTALVASGDLSHRLIVGGPYEFEPTAHCFDEQIVDAVAAGDANGILGIDPNLRYRAGECGYRSMVIALGATEGDIKSPSVLSYEGPFGVGYMVAVLSEEVWPER
ncbi:MAG TPA: class III extradiol dioxygenase subunit B-like domain-containing protein [Blastocatellia bacterium]